MTKPYVPGWVRRFSDTKLDEQLTWAAANADDNLGREWLAVLQTEKGTRP